MPSFCKPIVQPLDSLAAQFERLGALGLLRIVRSAGEARQDRPARLQHEGAAPGDLDRVVQRLRQVGKQRRHVLAAFQIMVRRQAEAAVVGHHGIVRDGHQRIMRVEFGRRRKERLVGRHQRQFELVGEIDDPAFVPAIIFSVTLQFDVEPVAEQRGQRFQPRLGRAPHGRDFRAMSTGPPDAPVSAISPSVPPSCSQDSAIRTDWLPSPPR